MNPGKVKRERVAVLSDLPNIGKAGVRDLNTLGIHKPSDLVGCDPYQMFERLRELTGTRQDPCVLDTFISITRFMQGDDAKPWWHYTGERKKARPGPMTG